MADFNENQNGVFGGVQFNESVDESIKDVTNNEENKSYDIFGKEQAGNVAIPADNAVNFEPVKKERAITERGLWSRVKAFLFQEIDLYAPVRVELTPYQQKVENEINDFLHQEVTFKGIANLFKGKK